MLSPWRQTKFHTNYLIRGLYRNSAEIKRLLWNMDFNMIAEKHHKNIKIRHLNTNNIIGFKFQEIKSWLLSGIFDLLVTSEFKVESTFPSYQRIPCGWFFASHNTDDKAWTRPSTKWRKIVTIVLPYAKPWMNMRSNYPVPTWCHWRIILAQTSSITQDSRGSTTRMCDFVHSHNLAWGRALPHPTCPSLPLCPNASTIQTCRC